MNTRTTWKGRDPSTGLWTQVGEGDTYSPPAGWNEFQAVITIGEPVESPVCRSKFDWNGLSFQRKENVS